MTASVSSVPTPVIPGAAPAAAPGGGASAGASAGGGVLQGFDAMLATLFGVVDAAGIPVAATGATGTPATPGAKPGAKDTVGDKTKAAADTTDATQPTAEALALAALIAGAAPIQPQVTVADGKAGGDDAKAATSAATPPTPVFPPVGAATPPAPDATAAKTPTTDAQAAADAALAKLTPGAKGPAEPDKQAAAPQPAASGPAPTPQTATAQPVQPAPTSAPVVAAAPSPAAAAAAEDANQAAQAIQASGEVSTPKAPVAPARDRQAARVTSPTDPAAPAAKGVADATPTAPVHPKDTVSAASVAANAAAKAATDGVADDVAPVHANAGRDKAEAADPQGQPPAPATTELAVPTTTHAATVQVRGSPETVAQLAAQIVKKLDGRSTRFDVALDPAGLGKVDVRIEIGAQGRMTAAMSFDTPQAAAELRSRSNELHRALEQAGFNLNGGGLSFDVAGDRGQNARQFFDQQQQQQQNSSGDTWRGRAFEAALATAGDASNTALQGTAQLQSRRNSGVDIRI